MIVSLLVETKVRIVLFSTMIQHEYGGYGIHHQGIEMLLCIILTFCDITNFLWLVSFSMLKYVVAYLRL